MFSKPNKPLSFIKLKSRKIPLTYPKRNPLERYLDISLLAARRNFPKY